MIEIKALCAKCGPDLYFEDPKQLRFLADGEWVPCADLAEVITLAMAGVELRNVSAGSSMRPRAVFLVNGTAFCGLCVRCLLGAPNGVAEIIKGLGGAFRL